MPTITTPPPTYAFTDSEVYVFWESPKFDGSDPPYEPTEQNLRVLCQVIRYTEDHQATYLLAELSASYNVNTKRAWLNISPAFDMEITPPDPDSIAPEQQTFVRQQPKHWAKYELHFEDQFGIPAEIPETLKEAGPFFALKGGLPMDIVLEPSILQQGTAGMLLHIWNADPYVDKALLRPALKEQPQWMYFFLVEEIDLSIQLGITYKDGTTDVVEIQGLTTMPQGVNYIPTGWDQLDISDHADPEKEVDRWLVGVVSNLGALLFTQIYQLYPHQEHRHYLAMETGLGGIESVPFWGLRQYSVDSSRETTRLARTPWTTVQSGEYESLNTTANQKFKGRTGYVPKEYLNHIRQLICGELWLIDTQGPRFIKIVADQNSFRNLYQEDDDLFALEFDYRYAFDQPHLINF